MPTITRAADIASPPEAIWAYLADFSRWVEWDPDILAVTDTHGTLGDGGRFRIRMTRGMSTTVVCSEAVRARQVTWTGKMLGGTVTMQGTFHLEPVSTGRHTRLRYGFTIWGPVGRLLGRLGRQTVARAVEEGLRNIAEANGGLLR